MQPVLNALRSTALLRVAIVAIAAVTALLIAASPALGHFCYRQFNSNAAANAAKSQAWITADEWLGFLDEIRDFLPPDCADAMEAELLSSPEGRLYMGPGLLAGGTLMNGKGNTPSKVGYLILAPECEELFHD